MAVAQLMQAQAAIPIQYRRASTVLDLFESGKGRIVAPKATITSDDANSRLIVKGTVQDVADVRKAVALIDVPRLRAELAIDIQAPADKQHYRQTVQLYGGESWTFEQPDLGLKIKIAAGDNLGSRVTLTVLTDYRHHGSVAKFRLRPGESATQSDGKVQLDDPAPGVHVFEQAPILTFKFTGLTGD